MRETIKKQQMQQQMQQMNKGVVPQGLNRNAMLRANMPSIANQHATILTSGQSHITPQQLLMAKNLTPHEQQMLQKQLAQHGRIVVASSGQVTPGMKTIVQGPIHGPAVGGGKVMHKQNILLSPAMTLAAANAAKEKPRNTHYSSAVGYLFIYYFNTVNDRLNAPV